MTRQERAAELNALITTEAGLNEIVEIYRQECDDAAQSPDVTYGLMIDQILEAEFPSQPPAHLAESR